MQQPLYILPFDHRSSFYSQLLGFKRPLTKKQVKIVRNYKRIVFDGFMQVYNKYPCQEQLGILLDEEFGKKIYKVCKRKKINLIQTVEKSGYAVFHFEYGAHFRQHLLKVKPDYAKVLVRYNPEDQKDNLIQLKRLKRLHDFCQENYLKYVFELLIIPSLDTLQKTKMKRKNILELRNRYTARAIREIRNFGIEPDIWKLEPQESAKEWQKVLQVVRPDQRVIVLGRAGSKQQVSQWLKKAVKFDQIIGFAVGRTVFFDALRQYEKKKISCQQAVDRIARNYAYFIKLWEKAKNYN